MRKISMRMHLVILDEHSEESTYRTLANISMVVENKLPDVGDLIDRQPRLFLIPFFRWSDGWSSQS
jgi:hypothetical protein